MGKKKIIIFSIVISVLIIISILVILLTKNNKQEDNKINIEELENNFSTIFTNNTNVEVEGNNVYLAYDIEMLETGKYKIDANIPNINIDTQIVEIINSDIFNGFVKKIVETMENSSVYTIYSVDYTSYLNNNILSLVIKCTLKEGANPQRLIIKTYNYDIQNDKLLTLQDIINLKNLNQEETQNKIQNKIQEKIEKVSAITESGYNIYKRDINNSIYKIKNTTEYFLGEKNILYIIYPYGNNSYTSEMDLIILE